MRADGAERFTGSRPEPAGDLCQGIQHILFSRDLQLFFIEKISGRAGFRAQSQDELVTHSRNAAVHNRGAPGAFADLSRHLGSQPRVRRPLHQPKRLPNPLVGNEAQEGRLLKLNSQAFAKRFIEDGVASPVVELSQDDGVLFGEPGSAVKVSKGADRRRCDHRGSYQGRDEAPSWATDLFRIVAASRGAVAAYAQQVGADLGCVPVPKIPIFRQAFGDDPVQIRRQGRVQLRRRGGVWRRTARTMLSWVSPANGRQPVAISYSTTPNENRSVRGSSDSPGSAPETCGRPSRAHCRPGQPVVRCRAGGQRSAGRSIRGRPPMRPSRLRNQEFSRGPVSERRYWRA